MKISRRKFLHLAVGAAALPAMPRSAWALDYPTRPVRIIVGFPPAGGNDVYARLIAQWLSQRLGQPFVVENRPGAGGNLGTELVAKSPADGYTLLLVGSGATWNATLYKDLKFNFIRDIEPIATIVRSMGVLVVNPALPAQSIAELIAYAKSNPRKLSVASAGVGSAPFMYWELFKTMTGIKMQHVPYRGGGPALVDLLGGQVQVYFSTMPAAIEYIKSGKLRALAVTGATRADLLPGIPMVGEFVPGYEASIWLGICSPKYTAAEIVYKLNKEINTGLADGRMQARIASLGDAVFASSSEDFHKLIADDTDKWAKVIRTAGIKAE
jgi:tripartite-type tricarboxylate transporter receptor subunit TctC